MDNFDAIDVVVPEIVRQLVDETCSSFFSQSQEITSKADAANDSAQSPQPPSREDCFSLLSFRKWRQNPTGQPGIPRCPVCFDEIDVRGIEPSNNDAAPQQGVAMYCGHLMCTACCQKLLRAAIQTAPVKTQLSSILPGFRCPVCRMYAKASGCGHVLEPIHVIGNKPMGICELDAVLMPAAKGFFQEGGLVSDGHCFFQESGKWPGTCGACRFEIILTLPRMMATLLGLVTYEERNFTIAWRASQDLVVVELVKQGIAAIASSLRPATG